MGRLATFLLALLFAFSSILSPTHQADPPKKAVQVDVGVVLDMESVVGKICQTCLDMAVEDFYKGHPNYTTRLVLHTTNSGNDSVGAASATLDLLKNLKVQAILGPERSAQASFVIDLGNKAQVPIISFSVTSPSLSPAQTPYFIRTADSSLSHVGAIASIIKAFGWREVVPIYEDTEYGNGLLPYLVDAFQSVNAQIPYRCVISPSATNVQITSELSKLRNMPTRVFVVHMLPPLSSRLFRKLEEAGMMTEGYAWIITEGLTDLLDPLDPRIIDSMQGVLGVRPYVPISKELHNFTARWRMRISKDYPDVNKENLSIFGLWAYDTAWAMATAVEKVGAGNLGFKMMNISGDSTDLAKLGVSENGPKLRQALLDTKFRGISGEFNLVDGQLQSPTCQIINFIGSGGRGIGFWTQADGISRHLNSTGKKESSFSKVDLNPIIWPGELSDAPKGWEVPTKGKVLKVGIPVKGGFIEFVNTKLVPSGYCIEVFDAVMQSLPYPIRYEYIPYEFAQHPGSYNDLVDQVVFQKFDAVVGDVTIIANRSLTVDFTLPYTESGVSMVVPIKADQNKNAWIFVKPLTMELWLGSFAFFFFTGFVVWFIEHRINVEFRGPLNQQMGTIFYFAFSTLVFAHKEKLVSNLSRLIVIIWVFVVLILTSSYTASLASMLTVEQLQPTVTNIYDLLKNGDSVGYQDGSFVRGVLKSLNFDDSKLKNYSTHDAYADALSKGSRNGGVAAIFDEIPYIKLFLANHCSEYVMVGKTFKTDGFGFVFPKGSPLVPDVSRAVLNVTQGEKMQEIEKKWFGDQTGCPTESSNLSSNRLQFCSFWGLFLITGVVSLSALVLSSCNFVHNNLNELKDAVASQNSLWKKIAVSARFYDNRDYKSHTFKKDEEAMSVDGHDSVTGTTIGAPSMTPTADGSQSPFSRFDPLDEVRPSFDLDDTAIEHQVAFTSIEPDETRPEQ